MSWLHSWYTELQFVKFSVYFYNLVTFWLCTSCILKNYHLIVNCPLFIQSFGMYSHCISPLYKQSSFSSAARLSDIVKDKSWAPRDMPWDSILGKHWGGSRRFWNNGNQSDRVAQRDICCSWPWRRIVAVEQFRESLRFSVTVPIHGKFIEHE